MALAFPMPILAHILNFRINAPHAHRARPLLYILSPLLFSCLCSAALYVDAITLWLSSSTFIVCCCPLNPAQPPHVNYQLFTTITTRLSPWLAFPRPSLLFYRRVKNKSSLASAPFSSPTPHADTQKVWWTRTSRWASRRAPPVSHSSTRRPMQYLQPRRLQLASAWTRWATPVRNPLPQWSHQPAVARPSPIFHVIPGWRSQVGPYHSNRFVTWVTLWRAIDSPPHGQLVVVRIELNWKRMRWWTDGCRFSDDMESRTIWMNMILFPSAAIDTSFPFDCANQSIEWANKEELWKSRNPFRKSSNWRTRNVHV